MKMTDPETRGHPMLLDGSLRFHHPLATSMSGFSVRTAALLLILGGCFHPYGGGTVPDPEPSVTPAGPSPPADAAVPRVEIEDEDAPPPPRGDRAPRTITVRALADEQVRVTPEWREKIEAAVGLASQPFRPLAIAFKIVGTGHWETPPGEDSLPLLLERAGQQPKEGADVLIGLIGGPSLLPEAVDQLGRAQYPEDVVVARWAAPETLAKVLAHEFAHLLGAVHVEESGSLMRSTLGQAGTALDRYNAELVDANREREFARGRPPLREEEVDWALDAVRKLLRGDRHNRDAEDMKTLLNEYRIRLKAWQSEQSAGGDEAAARRESALALVEEARAHFASGRRGKALAFLREALRTDPECPEAHLEIGKDLFARGKIAEALAELFAEIKTNPESADAFYYVGLCHEKEGRSEQAREAFQTALRFDPKHEKAREKVGP